MNSVNLVGRIATDLDLKYTAGGTAVVTFNLAVNRNFTNAEGEREADFIRCVAWRKTAEVLTNYMKKGNRIGLEGRLQTRNYENSQGYRVFITEVVINNVYFLESKKHNQGNDQQGFNGQPQTPASGAAAQQGFYQPSPYSGGDQINITDDDLPF